jgi:hypothetical protein
MSLDPVTSNPDHDKVVFGNDRVRVLEYTDQPGERTTPHRHPDSVMYTVSNFQRRLVAGGTHATWRWRQVQLGGFRPRSITG